MADEVPTGQETAPAKEPKPFRYVTSAQWLLTGDAGSMSLDSTVEFCVTVGLEVAFVKPGAYRVHGPIESIKKVCEWVGINKPSPISFAVEQPPDVMSLSFKVAPVREPLRSAEIHGMREVERLVARAIDSGLAVWPMGIKHFRATGPTRLHVEWLAALFEVTTARALELMQLTPEQAAAEDAAAPMPAVNVVLPVRETLSNITRDPRTGDITRVVQTERSV